MDRRLFLAGGAGAISTLSAEAANAAYQCTPLGPSIQRCVAGVSSIQFQAAYSPQHASFWCWAASISMVFAYYGHPVSQQRIVSETWGAIVNMPGSTNQILSGLNRPWIDDNGYTFQSAGDALTANARTAIADLAAGQPLLIGTLGHCMVLSALNYDVDGWGNVGFLSATVRDPWPYNPGMRPLTRQEWNGVGFLARVRVF